MTEFLEMTAREIHLRLAVAKCLGYWVCQFGAINQTVHLWEFDCYAHRAESRVAMMQSSELVERFLTPVMQMVNKQHSQMLRLLPGTSLNCPAKPGGAYELVSLCMKSSPTVWLPKAAEMVPACNSVVHTSGASVVAAFKTEFGPLNECIFLLHYPSFDMHLQYAEAIMSNDECFKLVSKFANMVAEGHNKGMTPFPGLQTAMQ
ncbi:PREDICTED: protein NipSnap homolog 3A-like isoform X2 [Priapulus caudatus]|nr:PREDICTED: protein NipSnap homolog 3A-like isoform X2 [Priapulus caudatus]